MTPSASPTPSPASEGDGPTLIEGLVVLGVMATAGVAAWLLYGPMIAVMLRAIPDLCARWLGQG